MTTALLGVAHGSRDPRSAAAMERLMAAVRRQSRRPVATGYLELSRPGVDEAFDGLVAGGATRVVVVPLLLGAGYHSRVDVPREVALARLRHPGVEVHCAEVLGPDPLLTAGLERRLRAVGVRPRSDTSVVLAAAGTSDPMALHAIEALAARWRAAAGWRAVQPAYAAASSPSVGEAVAMLRAGGADRIAVSAYVLAPGRLPDRIVSDAPAEVPVAAPLGDAPELVRVVLARFAAAAAAAPRPELALPA